MHMERFIAIAAGILCLAVLVSPAVADWDEGDGHKMHYPQLPDENGWDVRNTYYVGVADDWQCSESGAVTDFHVWISVQGDDPLTWDLSNLDFIHTAIYTDLPVGPQGWSCPDQQVWHHDWMKDTPIGSVTLREYGTGDQGWYDPALDQWNESDHQTIYQLNFVIDDPLDAFEQVKDEVYWLEISPKLPLGADTPMIGWKTSKSTPFRDDAVWREIVADPPTADEWTEIRDPITTESLDMAFVITPEPASMALLALGGLAVLLRRKR
jgi:hypothetical protein